MQNELNNCFETIRELKSTASGHCPFTQESLQNNDYVRFYMGLPNFSVLKSVFDYVVPPKSTSSSRNPTKLDSFQEFMITLAKLRLDSPLQEFAYWFDISMATVSRIFLKWLTIHDVKLRPLIKWLDRAMLWTSTPACYRASFDKKVVIILDCFEIFIE